MATSQAEDASKSTKRKPTPAEVEQVEILIRHCGLKPSSVFGAQDIAIILQRTCSALSGRNIDFVSVDDLSETQEYFQLIASMRKSASDSDAFDEKLSRCLAMQIIELFYATSFPQRYELFTHMSAGELFFIDGDSLLVEALCNCHVDWTVMQSLHIVFLVEKFLSDLLSRGGHFHIIFFDCFDWIWSRSPAKRLIRSILQIHLERLAKNTGKFFVKRFANWWEPLEHKKSFAYYAKRFAPEFMMVNDAEQIVPARVAEYSLVQEEMKAEARASQSLLEASDEEAIQCTAMFHGLILANIALRVHVVFTSRVLHKDNGLMAFVIRAHSSKFLPLGEMMPSCGLFWRTLAGASQPPTLTSEDQQAIDDVLQASFVTNTRELVITLALSDLLSDTNDKSSFALAKAFAISALVQARLTARQRAQPLYKDVNPVYISFVRDALSHALHWVEVVAQDDVGVDETITDLFDVKLFLRVALILSQNAGSDLRQVIGPNAAEEFAAMWRHIIPRDDGKKHVCDALPKVGTLLGSPPPISDLELKISAHPLLSRLVSGAAPQQDAELELVDRQEGALIANHWEMRDPLPHMMEPAGLREAERSKAELEKLPRAKRRKREKQEAKLIANIHATAQSMNFGVNVAENSLMNTIVDEDRVAEEDELLTKQTQSHAGQHVKRKKVLTKEEQITRENILDKAHKKMSEDEDVVTRLHRDRNVKLRVDGLKTFLFQIERSAHLRNSYQRLMGLRADASDQAEDLRVWRLFVGYTKLPEAELVVGKSKDKYVGLDLAAAFTESMAKEEEVTLKAEIDRLVQQAKGAKEGHLSKKDAEKIAAKQTKEKLFPGCDLELHEKRAIMQGIFIRTFENHIKFRARVSLVDAAFTIWKEVKETALAERRELKPSELDIAVKLFITVQDTLALVQQTSIRPRVEDRNKLRRALLWLDFGDSYLRFVDDEIRRWEDRSIDPLPKEEVRKLQKYSITRFQMRCMGHLLPRPRPEDFDPRVPFKPDVWQRHLLDIVDRRRSVVVCAPTSSGKTFVSYYCIKNVLKRSNTDVVVYVAPTRALINQAVSDVYSRYGGKRYDEFKHPAMQVYGILGGAEFVQKPFKCQVLITLPETFEALLLSPKFQSWSAKIKYVIFDEIHSIDNGGNGDVWERLLMLVRCPFIALSATLGQTDQLLAWLNRVQQRLKLQGHTGQELEVDFVPRAGERIQRWSDIQKHAYLPLHLKKFTKMPKSERKGTDDALLPIHPMSCVTPEMLQTQFPEDLPFVPSESLELYDVMVEVAGPLFAQFGENHVAVSMREALQKLNPDEYFARTVCITQTHARQYEQELKNEIMRWGRFSGKNWAPFDVTKLPRPERKLLHASIFQLVANVLNKFRNDVMIQETNILQNLRGSEMGNEAAAPPEKVLKVANHPDTLEFVQECILNALVTLRREDMLPAIVFCFEEEDCAKLVERVVTQLEDAEEAFRRTDEFRAYTKKMALKAQEHAKRVRTMHSWKGETLEHGESAGGGDDERRDRGIRSVSTAQLEGRVEDVEETHEFVVPDILDEFTFSGAGELGAEDLKSIRDDMKNHKLVLRAFERGIGIHHKGIKGKLRIHFERLFRQKHLPVIFATETLALGVHSPCRTVILAGDHMQLNTMQFRQMSGRAGRRNIDLIGHTVFIGVPFTKIRRLMTSSIMVLKGHVQVDCAAELRLQMLHDSSMEQRKQSKRIKGDSVGVNKAAVGNMADCLLEEPLFFFGRAACRNYRELQIRHLQYVFEFFHQHGLMFAEEEPYVSSLAAMIARALGTFKEVHVGNSAFLFAHILNSGLLHKMCPSWIESDELLNAPPLEQLFVFMSYLFTRNAALQLPLEAHRSMLHHPALFPRRLHSHLGVLPSLRSLAKGELLSLINSFNAEVLDLFGRMMRQCAKEERKFEKLNGGGAATAPKLPLAPSADASVFASARSVAGTIYEVLHRTQLDVLARSPFIALAGLDDHFISVEDLLHSLRAGLFLDSVMIPTLDFSDLHRHDGAQILINACVYDFARHRSQLEDGRPSRKWLSAFNGLNSGASWNTLSKFLTAVENLCDAVEKIASPSHQYNPRDEMDSFIRSRRGNLIACCFGERCASAELDDIKRYGQRIIRGQVWQCIDCHKKGEDVFICEKCFQEMVFECDKDNKPLPHSFVPYVEDNFVHFLQQMTANVEEWVPELGISSAAATKSQKTFKAGSQKSDELRSAHKLLVRPRRILPV